MQKVRGHGDKRGHAVKGDPALLMLLTLLEPQSRFGDKPIKFQVVCPQNGTAVLEGLRETENRGAANRERIILCQNVVD